MVRYRVWSASHDRIEETDAIRSDSSCPGPGRRFSAAASSDARALEVIRRHHHLAHRALGEGVGSGAALLVAPLDGSSGTTDRRRIVVEWNDAAKEAGLPANLFIKSSPLTAKNRVMVGALDMAVNEVHFYNHAAASLKDVVPKAWFAFAGIGARFLIVLEDIVADGGHPYALADRCEIDHARGLIDAFADLHSQFWNSPRFTVDLGWARTWSRRPGYAVLKQFYSRGRAGALKLGRPEVTPAVRAVSAALDAHADSYYREFEAGPLTLLHGDSHLGNTFTTGDGRSGLLDWQVVWQGPGLREVSYWMTTGLEPDMRRAYESSCSNAISKACAPVESPMCRATTTLFSVTGCFPRKLGTPPR